MQHDDAGVPWIDSPFFNQRLAQSDLDEPTRAMVKFYAHVSAGIQASRPTPAPFSPPSAK